MELKRILILTVGFTGLFLAVPSLAQRVDGHERMNGYALSDYEEFIEEWPLVTVRYREDNGEIRFIYANDKAWKALKKGTNDYPNGSVFAKIAVVGQEDPNFPSSLVPAGTRRYQLMVKDTRKHGPETAGWGYALFDARGATFQPEDPATKTEACHACHQLVPQLDYIFAQPMKLEVARFEETKADLSAIAYGQLRFETIAASDLPASVKAVIPADVKSARVMRGPLEKAIFSGTVDEIRPALIREVVSSGMPALLMDGEGEKYSLAFPAPAGERACTPSAGGKGMNIIMKAQAVKAAMWRRPMPEAQNVREFCAPIPD